MMRIIVEQPAEAGENVMQNEPADLFVKAYEIADRIHGEVVSGPAAVEREEIYLRLDESGLSLVQGRMELRGDFGQMLRRVLGGNIQHEKLLRAARWKGMPDEPLAVDATAGLGEDSFILAAAGYHVIMCEYNPVIAALLRDALIRAQRVDSGTSLEISHGYAIEGSIPEHSGVDPGLPLEESQGVAAESQRETVRGLQQTDSRCRYDIVEPSKTGSFSGKECGDELREIAFRMELIEGDGAEILASLERRPDLVYLDPMFPAKRKSGISTKKLQMFQKLEAPCIDEEVLMDAAWAATPSRIIVKRPVKGQALAGRRPGFSIECRNVRYDCYLPE